MLSHKWDTKMQNKEWIIKISKLHFTQKKFGSGWEIQSTPGDKNGFEDQEQNLVYFLIHSAESCPRTFVRFGFNFS